MRRCRRLSGRYEEKQRQERELGEVYYDRLTHCEPSAYPRWLVEPYHKEFALGRIKSWLMQEFMNETRRVFTDGRPHDTPEGHTWLGDSIGFWDRDKLVIWTTGRQGRRLSARLSRQQRRARRHRGLATSQRQNGQPDRIVVQATMYDPVGLTAPWNVATSYVKADYRVPDSLLGLRAHEQRRARRGRQDDDGSAGRERLQAAAERRHAAAGRHGPR